jgi:hypothetical protein
MNRAEQLVHYIVAHSVSALYPLLACPQVKQCKHFQDPAVRRLLARELRVLRSLPKHPCVVELLDAFSSSTSGRPHFVFDLMERSLHDVSALCISSQM